MIQDYNGEPLVLTVKRDTEILEISLNPVKSSQDGSYKGGLWVRDSTAGIGTVTFIILKTDYSEDWGMVFVILIPIV